MVKQFFHKPLQKLAMFSTGMVSKEHRQHPRARIKWPVVMTTSNGLLDGKTQNLSLGGAFICCPGMPNLSDSFRLVISAKERLILVVAEVVWPDARQLNEKTIFRGMGVQFTTVFGDDRQYLSGVISNLR